jgi:integrase
MSYALSLQLAAHIKAYPSVPVTLPWGTPDGKPHTFRLLVSRGESRPWNGNAFGYWWRRARTAAKKPATRENGMHGALRHTAASVWLDGGVDIRKLATWMGHEDANFSLKTYTHVLPDLADRGGQAMDAFLNATRSGVEGQSALDVPSEGRP